MMSVIKFRSLFLALFVSTASGYGQAEETELTPKCGTSTVEGEPACWLKAENHDNCYIWNSYVRDEETVTWSGQCRAGKPHGRGKATWGWRHYGDDGDIKTRSINRTGSYVDGKKHGRWEDQSVYSSGKLAGVSTGRYINDKRQGRWRYKDTDGDTQAGPYVDGKRHGKWEERTQGDSYRSDRVSTGHYVNGKKHGRWARQWWDKDDGDRWTVITPYVNGEKHGVEEWSTDDGYRNCYEYEQNVEIREFDC